MVYDREELAGVQAVLARHSERLLTLPGCTAVAIGQKEVGREPTDRLAIVVFVREKLASPPAEQAVPPELDGVPTDVVEQEFRPEPIATDPHERFDPLISGIALTADVVPSTYGSVGCFISTTGKPPTYPAGTYLLTNEHVVQHAGINGLVIQPDWLDPTPPPNNYACGNYLEGFQSPTNDCAIVSIVGRGWRNEVPRKPGRPGRRSLQGVVPPAVGTEVSKFGATTRYTTATVRFINWSNPQQTIQNALYIRNDDRRTWVDGGDSGSVAVTDGGYVMGLNFMADAQYPAIQGGGYYAGLAYPIQDQMDNFRAQGGQVTLA